MRMQNARVRDQAWPVAFSFLKKEVNMRYEIHQFETKNDFETERVVAIIKTRWVPDDAASRKWLL